MITAIAVAGLIGTAYFAGQAMRLRDKVELTALRAAFWQKAAERSYRPSAGSPPISESPAAHRKRKLQNLSKNSSNPHERQLAAELAAAIGRK